MTNTLRKPSWDLNTVAGSFQVFCEQLRVSWESAAPHPSVLDAAFLIPHHIPTETATFPSYTLWTGQLATRCSMMGQQGGEQRPSALIL